MVPNSLALMQQEGPQPTLKVWSCPGAVGKCWAALCPLQPQHCTDKAPVLLESHNDGAAQEMFCSTALTIHLLQMSHRTHLFLEVEYIGVVIVGQYLKIRNLERLLIKYKEPHETFSVESCLRKSNVIANKQQFLDTSVHLF